MPERVRLVQPRVHGAGRVGVRLPGHRVRHLRQTDADAAAELPGAAQRDPPGRRIHPVGRQAGSQAARAAILAVGGSCTGWTTTSALVWAAPDSSRHVYDVTVSASCAN
ncbi:hypothetical protein AB0L44_15295 [Nonomuraea wenchangensis]|uniref:hypothetical protein n=1 Tax=Nonomuraea wenchangensis TaxID=568860 RepID=UPI003422AD67